MNLNDTQIILIAWIAMTVGGFAIFGYFADRRQRRKP